MFQHARRICTERTAWVALDELPALAAACAAEISPVTLALWRRLGWAGPPGEAAGGPAASS